MIENILVKVFLDFKSTFKCFFKDSFIFISSKSTSIKSVLIIFETLPNKLLTSIIIIEVI